MDEGEQQASDMASVHVGVAQNDDSPVPGRIYVEVIAGTGADGGEYCAIWLGPELPGDQRRDDALSACWTSAPLESDTVILGAPKVCLTCLSDQPQCQIAVRLNHVHPDGASTRITYGVLNLSHRSSAADPQPMPVGDVQEVEVMLDHAGYTVPAGHRIRVLSAPPIGP